jgi:hypothetical protein
MLFILGIMFCGFIALLIWEFILKPIQIERSYRGTDAWRGHWRDGEAFPLNKPIGSKKEK